MTKFEIRALTVALLDIEKHDLFLDIGAGTGSISIQAALCGATVYAVEKTPKGICLIRQNAENFGVKIHIIQGAAPEAIESLPPFNKCFIGGSGGRLADIIATISSKLTEGGVLVANFIRLENLVQCQTLLDTYNFRQIETRLIQTAIADELDLMRGQNPVGIVCARKQG